NETGRTTVGSQVYQDLLRGDIHRQDPLNPIRYTAKRLDSGDGGSDMGARRWSPDYKRFYQWDQMLPSGADLGLTTGEWSANRYALAAGNPLNFMEAGGHAVISDEGG